MAQNWQRIQTEEYDEGLKKGIVMKMYYYFVICHQEQRWQWLVVITAQSGQQEKYYPEETTGWSGKVMQMSECIN